MDINSNTKNSSVVSRVSSEYLSSSAIVVLLVINSFNAVHYYSSANKYADKLNSYYYSDTFHNLSPRLKYLACLALLFLSLVVLKTNRLIYQRMSVPELLKHRWKTFFVSFLTVTMLMSFYLSVFEHKKGKMFSYLKLGLVENAFYSLFSLSSIGICLVLFNLTQSLMKNEKQDRMHLIIANFKLGLLFLSLIQVFLYVASLMTVSYCTASNKAEQYLLDTVKSCGAVNSIFFSFTILIYHFTICIDYHFIKAQLNSNLDLEFFIDEKEELTKY